MLIPLNFQIFHMSRMIVKLCHRTLMSKVKNRRRNRFSKKNTLSLRKMVASNLRALLHKGNLNHSPIKVKVSANQSFTKTHFRMITSIMLENLKRGQMDRNSSR
jgi:hypothetical protein